MPMREVICFGFLLFSPRDAAGAFYIAIISYFSLAIYFGAWVLIDAYGWLAIDYCQSKRPSRLGWAITAHSFWPPMHGSHKSHASGYHHVTPLAKHIRAYYAHILPPSLRAYIDFQERYSQPPPSLYRLPQLPPLATTTQCFSPEISTASFIFMRLSH